MTEDNEHSLDLRLSILESRFSDEFGSGGGNGEIDRSIDRVWQEHRSLAERVNHFIDGNGKEGANVRFDRLEQAAIAEKERHNKWFGILSAGLVTALGVAVKGAFFG